MYKITWDKETGGVLLHSRIVEGTLGKSIAGRDSEETVREFGVALTKA